MVAMRARAVTPYAARGPRSIVCAVEAGLPFLSALIHRRTAPRGASYCPLALPLLPTLANGGVPDVESNFCTTRCTGVPGVGAMLQRRVIAGTRGVSLP